MKDFTLIANSGIHLLSFEFIIDFNDSKKILFYETEDLVNNKCSLELAYQLPQCRKVYYLSDMIERGLMNEDHATHNTINPEIHIQTDTYLKEIETNDGDISHHPELFFMRADNEKYCKIENLYNHWLPVPFYELSDGLAMDKGPYNWCRIKIIPIGEKKDNKQEVHMLMAFDTHALYPYQDEETGEWENTQVEYPECPIFDDVKNNAPKIFRFCYQLDKWFDYSISNKGWVKEYLRSIVHPDAPDVDQIKVDKVRKNERKYAFLASYIWLLDYIQRVVKELPEVRLIPDRGEESVPVEMVIDIGNSRTAAVLFEMNNTLRQQNDFSQVTLLRLQNFLQPLCPDGRLNRTQESFDMRIAFQTIDFGKNIYNGSTQFIWPSMVRLGQEAQLLTNYTINLAEGKEGYCTYSSPKRYLWDNKAINEEWLCVMKGEDGKHQVPKLPNISKFFERDGQINRKGFGRGGVHYSRKTLMTLAFMEIIAQAKAQINGHEYRYAHDKRDFGRFLDKIVLTCPTGMSKVEQKALHDCLKDAIFVLDSFYQQNDQSYIARKIQIIPDLDAKRNENAQWIFDEATCSQFVYLYGLFREKYRNCSEAFFTKYGKKREGKDSIIIGSLDIGAGTSDVMVCRYDYNEKIPARLKPVPLFWDSFNIAGDDMLHDLIYNVLIQGENGIIEKNLRARGFSEADIHGRIFEFFGRDNTNQDFPDRIIRRDFNLQVLVPIMYEFLRLLSNGEPSRTLHYSEFFKTTEPSIPVIEKFKKIFGMDISEIEWEYNPDILSKYASNSMDAILKPAAHLMCANDCDVIILSGRPTSLEAIQKAFNQYCSVQPNRLIFLNKHHIGEWYPFADKERHCINNSKSIVPMGAMLGYLAANLGGYEGFSLDLSELGAKLTPTTENFVVLDDRMDNTCFITPLQQKGIVTVNSYPMQVYIGTKQYDLALYPIRPFYELTLNMDDIINRIRRKNSNVDLSKSDIQQLADRESQKLFVNSPLKVKIERPNYRDNKEALEIESVQDNAGNDLDRSNFKLSIQSLNDPNGYWLDTGSFSTNIAQ